MKYKLVIFDLDGTLLDSLEDLTDSVNYSLNENNMPTHTIEEVKHFVGNGIKKLIYKACPPKTSIEIKNKVYEDFTNYYNIHCNDKTKPYDNIKKLLEELKKSDVKIAVLSNKDDYAVSLLCNKFFPSLIDFVYGAKKDIKLKPYPDAINTIIELSSISKSETVYIGDSEVDIQTALNSNIDCISVCWGFRTVKELQEHSAKLIVSTTEELCKVLM